MQDNCGTWWCRKTQRRSYTARTLLLHHHLHLLYLLHLACLACHQIDKKLCWLHSVKHSWFLPNPFPLLGMFFSAYSPQSFLSILSWMICTHQLKTQNTLPIGWISLFPSPPWNTMLILVLSTLTKSPGAYIFDVILIHPPHSWQLMFWLDRFPVVLVGSISSGFGWKAKRLSPRIPLHRRTLWQGVCSTSPQSRCKPRISLFITVFNRIFWF